MSDDIPERIWASCDTHLAQKKSGSWHEYPYGKEYVSADFYKALQSRVAELEAALAGARDDAL